MGLRVSHAIPLCWLVHALDAEARGCASPNIGTIRVLPLIGDCVAGVVNEIEPSLVEVVIEVPDAQVDAEGRLVTLEVDRKLSICTVDELVAGDVLHLD
jgi:hypothetical protein